MMQHIWLLSDLDGTLLPSDKQIPAKVLAGIQQFTEQGGHFTMRQEEHWILPVFTGNSCMYKVL